MAASPLTWLGVGAGGFLIWAGFTGEHPIDVLREVFSGGAFTREGRLGIDIPAYATTPAVSADPLGTVNGFMRPVPGPISSPFGMRNGRLHAGIDISCAVGTPVRASKAGTVTRKDDPGGYGWYVDIDHGNAVVTRYAHLSAYVVADGANVAQGAIIGRSGGREGAAGAGNSQGPHLHFELRRAGVPVPPPDFTKAKAPKPKPADDPKIPDWAKEPAKPAPTPTAIPEWAERPAQPATAGAYKRPFG